jgi:beta-galactosidase
VQSTTRQEKFMATFDVPYAAGELKAIGYTQNAPVSERVLATAGDPVAVRLSPDRASIQAQAGDLSFITVEIVDQAGLMHPAADRPVYFTIKGEGILSAVGNANPTSTEGYCGNVRSTFRGRALVVVKSNGQPGVIYLRAQADGLEGSEVLITTH